MRAPASPLRDFTLERYFAKWEFVARYLLSSSDVEGMPMSEALALADAEARALWDTLALGYTETAGHPLLRAEIAKLCSTASPADVLCTVSAEEAIFSLMNVLIRPGDHVIALWPNYQSSYEVARGIGAEVSAWELVRDGGRWRIDLDALRALLRPQTRLICVNFPNNPTGALPTRAEWQAIIDVARDAGCYLLSDEVYRLMEFDPADRLAPACDAYERAVSIGAMSKAYGMAGLRVGWLIGRDRDLLERVAAFKDYTTICGSAPSEVLALIALRASDTVVGRSMDIIRPNRRIVEAFMGEHADGFDWIPPQAGTVGLARWLGPGSAADFADALVRATGVMLLPAGVFDLPDNAFRIGLGRRSVPEALARLSAFARAM